MKSEKAYVIQKKPFIVPASDGKMIAEFFGLASMNAGDLSFAHMSAPPGWSEPFQTPEFDEITFVISGKKQFEIESNAIILEKNQAICVMKGNSVKYSNPFDESVDYISICRPAFSIDKVHREPI